MINSAIYFFKGYPLKLIKKNVQLDLVRLAVIILGVSEVTWPTVGIFGTTNRTFVAHEVVMQM